MGISWADNKSMPVYLAAQHFLDGIGQNDNEMVISDEISQVTPQLFEGTDDDPNTDPNLVREAAFLVGFAVCWLVMTSIGGAR